MPHCRKKETLESTPWWSELNSSVYVSRYLVFSHYRTLGFQIDVLLPYVRVIAGLNGRAEHQIADIEMKR